MLKLENIDKSFAGKAVLSDVSIHVPTGHTHALIGSSGSGKTTLLRITLGLIPLDRGYVKIAEQPLSQFAKSDWASRIGYVPQEGGLFPHLTAEENILLVAKIRHWPKAQLSARLEEVIQLVGVKPELLLRYPSELSGGQRQRIALMRAAFLDPPLLLLDEPMGALDPLIRSELQSELKAIFLRLKKTVVLVTHDLSEAVYFAHSITLLHQGKIVQSGSFAEMVKNPVSPFVTRFIQAQRTLPAVDSKS